MNSDRLHDNNADAVLGEWVRLDHPVRWMIFIFCLRVRQNGENLRAAIARGPVTPMQTKQTPLPPFHAESSIGRLTEYVAVRLGSRPCREASA